MSSLLELLQCLQTLQLLQTPVGGEDQPVDLFVHLVVQPAGSLDGVPGKGRQLSGCLFTASPASVTPGYEHQLHSVHLTKMEAPEEAHSLSRA